MNFLVCKVGLAAPTGTSGKDVLIIPMTQTGTATDGAPAGTADMKRVASCITTNYMGVAGDDKHMKQLRFFSQPWGTQFSLLYPISSPIIKPTINLGTENKNDATKFNLVALDASEFVIGTTIDTKLSFATEKFVNWEIDGSLIEVCASTDTVFGTHIQHIM